jgi:hypothetical protein
MGGTTADRARGIAVDVGGNIYVAGGFAGTADFDPGASNYSLTSAGGGDLFVAKLVQSGITSSLSATQHTAANARTTRSIGKAASSLARVPIAIDLALADADDWLDDLLLLVV